MSVSTSSINAFYNHVQPKLQQTQVEKIMAFMQKGGWRSRREISVATGIEPGAVAGRVNLMVKSKVLQESRALMECGESKRMVKMVRIPLGDQQDMFQ